MVENGVVCAEVDLKPKFKGVEVEKSGGTPTGTGGKVSRHNLGEVVGLSISRLVATVEVEISGLTCPVVVAMLRFLLSWWAALSVASGLPHRRSSTCSLTAPAVMGALV